MSEIDKVPKRLSEHIDYMKNAGGQKHLESFKKDFDSFHRLYKSLELTILAYKSGSIWINLGSQFKLSPIENTARTKFTKNYITDELILVKSRTGVKELWKFVKDLALG
ncbi:MAG TPA: hypothetical protein VHP63_02300, partial [candidate division Zixibacteria bacterium]|nr:hypothetical protein [candidate division Zixibacteria bacterium]